MAISMLPHSQPLNFNRVANALEDYHMRENIPVDALNEVNMETMDQRG